MVPRPRVHPILSGLWLAGMVFGLGLAGVSASRAQEVTGAIEGAIVDSSGTGVPGASIVLTGPTLQSSRVTTSDARGHFQIPLLPVGAYTLRVKLVGRREVVRTDLVVSLGHATDVGEIRLTPEAVPVTGVDVTASRSRALARRSAVGGNLTSRVFRALPSDRDYQSIVTLLPHTTSSYFGDRANIAGTTGPESNYYVDGANVVEPPGNGVSTSLPYNFIQEIEVRAGGSPAEFGGASGGIVNAVTASGGNEFSGQVFGFFANRLFTSNAARPSLSEVDDYRSWDAGASIGGPVVKDRMWYLLAFDPTYEREVIALPGFGDHPDTRRGQRFAAKLTTRVDDRTNLTVTALGDPGRRDQIGGIALASVRALGNIDPMLVTQHGGGVNVSARAMRILGPRSFLQLGGGVARARFTFEPSTARGANEPLFVDGRTGYVEGGVGSATDRRSGRYSFWTTVAHGLDDHTFKGGFAYDDEYFRERLDLDQILKISDTDYRTITLDDRHSSNHIRSPSAFVQDTWQTTSRVRIDAGLRWADEYWMASGGSLGQRIAGLWQPRAGFTWLLGADKAASAFGSVGRYAQRSRLNVAGFFLQDAASTYFVRRYNHDPRVDPSGGTIIFAQPLGHQPAVDGLDGAVFDEIQGGFERLLPLDGRATVRGVYRTQQSGVVGVYSPELGRAVYGNPGFGDLAAYPELSRTYRALEITLTAGGNARAAASLSYLYSSIDGNYEGYWDQTAGTNDPIGGASFVPEPAAATYSEGPLPNDRPHQIKGHASFRIGRGVAAGVTASWASGSPVSELGSTRFGSPYFVFLAPRGSIGRLRSVYDLNLRLAYDAPQLREGIATRLMMDVYHMGNPRQPVTVDQLHYLAVDGSGNQVAPNPNYLSPLAYQPAVAYRFGMEMTW